MNREDIIMITVIDFCLSGQTSRVGELSPSGYFWSIGYFIFVVFICTHDNVDWNIYTTSCYKFTDKYLLSTTEKIICSQVEEQFDELIHKC